MVLSIDRYKDGNKYLNVLELNISNIGRAAAKQSRDHFSLHSSGLSNVNVDNKIFRPLQDVAALNIKGPALSGNEMFKLVIHFRETTIIK